MDSAFSTPCQLRAMWLCLYLQEKVLYNEMTVKFYHMMVVCMPLVGERALGTHLVAAGFFSPLFSFCIPNFAGKPGQHLWDCAMKWLIPLSTGITIRNYVAAGETPSELVKASPHQREAPRRLRENHTRRWGRSCPSPPCCSHEQAVLLSWKLKRQEYFPFFPIFICQDQAAALLSCHSYAWCKFSQMVGIPKVDPALSGLWQCQCDVCLHW